MGSRMPMFIARGAEEPPQRAQPAGAANGGGGGGGAAGAGPGGVSLRPGGGSLRPASAPSQPRTGLEDLEQTFLAQKAASRQKFSIHRGDQRGGDQRGGGGGVRAPAACRCVPHLECALTECAWLQGGGGPHVAGFLFVCSGATEGECLTRGLFGLQGNKLRAMQTIGPDTSLFLLNFKTHALFGPFKAAGEPALDIVPDAWKKRGQVRATMRLQLSGK